MEGYDLQLAAVRSYLAALRASGRKVRELSAPGAHRVPAAGAAIRVGPGAGPGVILRSETHVELGNPQVGSCGVVLWTTDCSSIVDGRVVLVGPDIPEAQPPGASWPFGQILMVGGRTLGPDDHPAISQAQHVGDRIEGYMVRSSARSVWARVSKGAAAKGLDFACLGRALIGLYRSSLAAVEAVEVAFVTADAAAVRSLEPIAAEVREAGVEMVGAHWKARGYDLDCNLDCRACHDKDVCDDIRKLIAARMRKERAAHV